MLVVSDGAEMEKLSVRYNTPQFFLSTALPHFSRFLQSGGPETGIHQMFEKQIKQIISSNTERRKQVLNFRHMKHLKILVK